MGEEKPDRLLSPRTAARHPEERAGRNADSIGCVGVFRGNLHLRESVHIQPVLIISNGFLAEAGQSPACACVCLHFQ